MDKELRIINLNVEIVVNADKNISTDEIIQELNYSFSSFDENVEVIDTEIIDEI